VEAESLAELGGFGGEDPGELGLGEVNCVVCLLGWSVSVSVVVVYEIEGVG